MMAGRSAWPRQLLIRCGMVSLGAALSITTTPLVSCLVPTTVGAPLTLWTNRMKSLFFPGLPMAGSHVS